MATTPMGDQGHQGDQGYVLGVNDAELQRLGFQHRLWSDATTRLWQAAGLRPGSRVLDVGCGPGYTAMDLAELVGPTGRVDAVDEASSYVEWLRDQSKKRGRRVDARVGDAQRLPALGLEPASYDLAYARWVLCFVPDPQAVLAGMVKLVRPGGAVVIQDYLSYWMMSVAPAEPIFARIIEGICASWRRRGGDPDVMRRVPTWLAELGCKVEHVAPHFLAARPGTLLWEWPASFFRNFVPVLESKELITPAERREFEAAWERWSKSDHVFVTTPPLVELVARV